VIKYDKKQQVGRKRMREESMKTDLKKISSILKWTEMDYNGLY
jgi:hypothetical protein